MIKSILICFNAKTTDLINPFQSIFMNELLRKNKPEAH